MHASTSFGLGTHIVRPELEKILLYGLQRGMRFIDTAPNYGNGKAHEAIGRLRSLSKISSDAKIITKAGFLSHGLLMDIQKGLVSLDTTLLKRNHLLTPELIHHQISQSAESIGRFDILLLHNPEILVNALNEADASDALRACFEVCEAYASDGVIEAYGIATWGTLFNRMPVCSLTRIAEQVAGAQHRFRYLELPINLVKFTEARDAILFGKGPLSDARQAGMIVLASSPLHGGELPKMLTEDFIDLFGRELSAAQACLQFTRSLGLVDTILVGCSSVTHVDEILNLEGHPCIEQSDLEGILRML